MRRDLELMAASSAGAAANADVHPAANWLAATVALHAGQRGWRGVDRQRLGGIRKYLDAREPDFWSVAGAIELDQYDAMAKRRLARTRPTLEKAYRDLQRRVSSTSA